jgi:hypothetical protein
VAKNVARKGGAKKGATKKSGAKKTARGGGKKKGGYGLGWTWPASERVAKGRVTPDPPPTRLKTKG